MVSLPLCLSLSRVRAALHIDGVLGPSPAAAGRGGRALPAREAGRGLPAEAAERAARRTQLQALPQVAVGDWGRGRDLNRNYIVVESVVEL